MIPKIRACCRLIVKGSAAFCFSSSSLLSMRVFFWSEGFKDGYTGNKDSTAFIMSRFRGVDTGGNGIVFAWQMGSLSLYRNGGLFFRIIFFTHIHGNRILFQQLRPNVCNDCSM